MTLIRTALIGLGWVGQHRHVPTIRTSGEFELVGLIDRRPDRARDLAAQLGLRHYAESDRLSGIDWMADIDAVVVATNPHDHALLVSQAIAAGKHVLTEKPFAMSRAEGHGMVTAAATAGRSLAVVHNFQFARSTRALEADVARGRLGEVRGLWAFQFGNPRRRLPTWYESLPLGLYYDESPHLLYLLRRFGGGRLDLQGADAHRAGDGRSTPMTLNARFHAHPAGRSVPATLSLFFDAPVSEWYFVVLGSNGLGVVDIFRDIYIYLTNDGTHATADVVRTSVQATWQHWSQHLSSGLLHMTGRLRYGNDVVYSRFAEAIRTGAPAVDVSSHDALEVLELQHDIIEACGAIHGA